eukprot:Nitzschia sp. Nitz4//scaffold4_size323378//5457//6077//NITZ4_000603-RA/size323378-processed-gene-0.317-mRNA-1//-1//CDS//3329553228//5226//frame0
MAPPTTAQVWLTLSNFLTSAAWSRVAFVVLSSGFAKLSEEDSTVCSETLQNAVRTALVISFVEVFNCVVGFTRSPLAAVLLFSSVRAGVEFLLAPLIPCGSWQHLLTVLMWGLGDTIRFGCFAFDTAFPGVRMAKSIRFTVGPILFPIGASGEMLMVLLAAWNGRPILYLAAALWPVGFYPMMQQLLKQRRKHFQPKDKTKQIKSV